MQPPTKKPRALNGVAFGVEPRITVSRYMLELSRQNYEGRPIADTYQVTIPAVVQNEVMQLF